MSEDTNEKPRPEPQSDAAIKNAKIKALAEKDWNSIYDEIKKTKEELRKITPKVRELDEYLTICNAAIRHKTEKDNV